MTLTKIDKLIAATTMAIVLSCGSALSGTLVLKGRGLTVETVVSAAREPGTAIEIDPQAEQRLADGFDLVMEAALQGVEVYGLTVGVGWNKDRPAFQVEGGKRVLDKDLLDLSRSFNLDQLRAHAAGFGEPLPTEVVRAAMLIRLNQMLTGMTGVQPAVAEMYRQFLIKGITPVVPGRGSIGQADITLAAHVGLAMIGEWQVDYLGKRMAASQALIEAGLSPIEPVGKDFLSIISSNALTAGHAALTVYDVEDYLPRQAVAYGLALEGFNGNVAPFLEETTTVRPFPGMVEAAAMIREALDGSYLWSVSDTRGLQDPLSYRTMAYALGSAQEAAGALKEAIEVQINHTDDNPATRTGIEYQGASSQVAGYQVKGKSFGAIYPTANFEMLPVTDKVEHLNLALARLARAVVMQTIRYENPDLTKLPRFLAAEGNHGLSFGAMQVPLTTLFPEVRMLAAPVSLDSFGTSAGIEDIASNAPLAVSNLERILDLCYDIASMQLLHAAQAVELRKPSRLGASTQRLFDAYRASVPFVDKDRAFTQDLANGALVLRQFEPEKEK